MPLMIRRGSGLAFALGALFMWALQQTGLPERQAEAGSRTLDRAGFDAALRTVLERYVDPIESSPVLTETLRRIVSGLDTYSHFLTADERAEIRQRSRGGSTGMETTLHRTEPGARKPASLEISAVLPRSPRRKVSFTRASNLISAGKRRLPAVQASSAALLLGAVHR